MKPWRPMGEKGGNPLSVAWRRTVQQHLNKGISIMCRAALPLWSGMPRGRSARQAGPDQIMALGRNSATSRPPPAEARVTSSR